LKAAREGSAVVARAICSKDAFLFVLFFFKKKRTYNIESIALNSFDTSCIIKSISLKSPLENSASASGLTAEVNSALA
jgi:hypothetical protein